MLAAGYASKTIISIKGTELIKIKRGYEPKDILITALNRPIKEEIELNKKKAKDNLLNLASKIGEKITLRRSAFVGKDKSINFSYTHSALKKNVGKLGVLLSLITTKSKKEILDLGKQLTMQIAASSPLAINKESLDQIILKKEKEIIIEELKNSGKDNKIIEKITIGRLNKFITENTLLDQEWIMEPKKKVKDVINEVAGKDKIEIKQFVRFRVGEGL